MLENTVQNNPGDRLLDITLRRDYLHSYLFPDVQKLEVR